MKYIGKIEGGETNMEFKLAGMASDRIEANEISKIASNCITHFRILDMKKE